MIGARATKRRMVHGKSSEAEVGPAQERKTFLILSSGPNIISGDFKFRKILKNSEKFQKNPKKSKKIPKNSKNLKNSRKFQKIPKKSKKFQKIPSQTALVG